MRQLLVRREQGVFGSRVFCRPLSIHEHQSMELLARYGVGVPRGSVARTPEEAVRVAQSLGKRDFVVKAQVLAGGRGKGIFDSGLKGGVHQTSSVDEVRHLAQQMLGHRLVTKQTGSAGRPCAKVYVCERLLYRREYYLALLLDRATKGPMLVGSRRGGMDIEAVAAEDPAAIVQCAIPAGKSLDGVDLERFIARIGVSPQAIGTLGNLYRLFVERDATMVEINPLVETAEGTMVCLDAKISFDDNAEFRQPELFALRDTTQEDPREVAASKHKLNYIGLDGTIGCLVNGAGLAMATMDIIKLHGGSPANFLDVGGSATADQVADGLCLLGSDPRVRAILVNIFGGIMRCDVVAEGVLRAVRGKAIHVPIVVRLQGTAVL